jgi:hypothetical protein
MFHGMILHQTGNLSIQKEFYFQICRHLECSGGNQRALGGFLLPGPAYAARPFFCGEIFLAWDASKISRAAFLIKTFRFTLFKFVKKTLHTMPTRAPTSHHLALYRYWLVKRGDRAMPTRGDIDPGQICALLPYVTILDKIDGQFRYRLHGSAVAREIGRDLTGGIVGSYVSTPASAAAMRAICERVFARAHPVFATGEFEVKSGSTHNISVLFLPLSEDGVTVNRALCTLVARFDPGITPSAGWLHGIPVKVGSVIDVRDAAELERCCIEWERHCADNVDW